MKRWCSAVVVVGLVFVGALAAPADSATIVRHSGRITSIDAGAGRMTLEEVGPWSTVKGETQTTRLAIALTADTDATLALRAPEAVGDGFPGMFVEVPLELSSLAVGDYVTVACEHARGRLIAHRVTVALEE